MGRNLIAIMACLVAAWGALAPATAQARPGDTNLDGEITVADVQCIVLVVLSLGMDEGLDCLSSAENADVDCSGGVNVVDAQYATQLAMSELNGSPGLPASVDSDADGVHNACDINPDYFDPEQADRDTLATLHCDSGEVAKWDGQEQSWICAPDDDTWLSEDQVLEMVSTVGYLLSEIDPLFMQSPAAEISEQDKGAWSMAYGWGDHNQAGYLKQELDPIFSVSPAAAISDQDKGAWSMAYGWGDHNQAGYLKQELDPAFSASPAAGIIDQDVDAWREAYGWGDHNQAGYLKQELDPAFSASPAAEISDQDKDAWSMAYGWGDHGQAGYLKQELDPVFSASSASVISDGDMDAWSMAYAWGDHGEQGYLKSESDPEVGQVTEGKWCRGQGGQVACDQEPPEDKDTLGGLNCDTDDIAKWNGSEWVCAEPGGSGGAVVAFAQKTFLSKTYVGNGDGTYTELGSHTFTDMPANTLFLVDINVRVQVYGNTGGTQSGYARVKLNGVVAEEKFIYTTVDANKWQYLTLSFSVSEKLYQEGDFTVALEVQSATWTTQQISFESPQVRIVAMPTQ